MTTTTPLMPPPPPAAPQPIAQPPAPQGMDRTLRGVLCVVWGVIGIAASSSFFVWLDRASARQETPAYSGWGILFVVGMLVLVGAAGYALRMHHQAQNNGMNPQQSNNRHFVGWLLAIISSSAVTACLILVPQNIGWRATGHAAVVAICVIVWGIVMFIVGHARDRH